MLNRLKASKNIVIKRVKLFIVFQKMEHTKLAYYNNKQFIIINV